MNVFDLSARIGLDSSDYDRGLNQAESGFMRVANGIKSGIGTIAKVTAAGFTAAAAGIAAISKQAIESYADYEQLVGGVETLFGAQGQSLEEYATMVGKSVDDAKAQYDKLQEAQEIVMRNAAEGYKSAGLSANEYMETVTSFSASLIASLGGDTVKAAEMSNKAIVDMADNANKMGTSMEAIQNAYNGFAKQNYTMLDNLKLGYGGTKEEMQRLLDDAEKLSGIKYDLSSFGDIVEAIHVVQKEMHISGISAAEAAEAVRNGTMTEAEALAAMGTTAREAATTISGSLSMMKSSWSNLITGVADDTQDFDSLINNFVDSVDTVAENILPRVEQALSGVGKLVEKLVPSIMERVPSILNDTLPQLIDSASAVLKTLVDTIVSNIDGIFSTAANLTSIGIKLIDQIAEGIVNNTDAIINGIGRIFNDLIESIGVLAPTLFDAGFQLIQKIGEGIIKYTPDLIDTAITALEDFAAYLADNAAVMLPKLVKLVGDIAKMLTDPQAIGRLVDAGLEIIIALTDAIIESIPVLVDALPEVIQNIVTAITDNLPKLLDAGWEIVKALTEALLVNLPMIIDAGGQIIDSLGVGIVQALMQLWEKLDEITTTIAEKVVEAFVMAWESLKKTAAKIKKTVTTLANAIKALLKPFVKKLKQYGVDLIVQFVAGIASKIKNVKDAINNIVKAITDKVTETVKAMVDKGKSMIQNLVDGIKNKINAVKTAVSDVTKAITDKISETVKAMINHGRNMIQNLVDGIKNKIQAVKDAIISVKNAIAEKFEEIINKAKEWGKNLIQNFVDKVKEKWESIKDGFFAIINGIRDGFTEIVSRAKNWGENLIKNFKEKFVEKWNAIKDGFFEKVNDIRTYFTDIVDKAKNWGKDLIQNFINGIQDKWEALKKKCSDVAQLVKDYLGFSEPEKGPLSNFHTYAPDMVALFSQGIRDSAYMITDALDSTLYRIQNAFTIPHSEIGNTMTANNYAVPEITEIPRENAVYNEGDNIFNITVQAGTIATDYDANRAAQVMAERLAALQSQQRRAIGL